MITEWTSTEPGKFERKFGIVWCEVYIISNGSWAWTLYVNPYYGNDSEAVTVASYVNTLPTTEEAKQEAEKAALNLSRMILDSLGLLEVTGMEPFLRSLLSFFEHYYTFVNRNDYAWDVLTEIKKLLRERSTNNES